MRVSRGRSAMDAAAAREPAAGRGSRGTTKSGAFVFGDGRVWRAGRGVCGVDQDERRRGKGGDEPAGTRGCKRAARELA